MAITGPSGGTCFVSHAYDDELALARLKASLSPAVTLRVFPRLELGGSSPPVSLEIERAIAECDSLIHLATATAVTRGWLAVERDFALRLGKPIYRFFPGDATFARDRARPLDIRLRIGMGPEVAAVVDPLIELLRKRHFLPAVHQSHAAGLSPGRRLPFMSTLADVARLVVGRARRAPWPKRSRHQFHVAFWSYESRTTERWRAYRADPLTEAFTRHVVLFHSHAPPPSSWGTETAPAPWERGSRWPCLRTRDYESFVDFENLATAITAFAYAFEDMTASDVYSVVSGPTDAMTTLKNPFNDLATTLHRETSPGPRVRAVAARLDRLGRSFDRALAAGDASEFWPLWSDERLDLARALGLAAPLYAGSLKALEEVCRTALDRPWTSRPNLAARAEVQRHRYATARRKRRPGSRRNSRKRTIYTYR
jgi:hypothetical protein